MGRKPMVPAEIRDRSVPLRKAGHTWDGIADTLNPDGVPTAQGGRQ